MDHFNFLDLEEECEQSQHTCVVTQVENARHRRMDVSEATTSFSPEELRGGGAKDKKPEGANGGDSEETDNTLVMSNSEGDAEMTDTSHISVGSSSDLGGKNSQPRRSKRKRQVTTKTAGLQISSEDEDADSPPSRHLRKKKQGRPANSPSHVGQYTAGKLRERKEFLKVERNEELALAIEEGTETIDKTVRRYKTHVKSTVTCAKQLADSSVQDVVNALDKEVKAIMTVAQKGCGMHGRLQKLLYDAAYRIEAGTRVLAARTETGHYDLQAGRAPSSVSPQVEDLIAANRRMEEEIRNLRKEMEELKRTSPPPSPLIPVDGETEEEERMEEDESGGGLGGILPSPGPSLDVLRSIEKEKAAHPARRPPIKGVSKILADTPLPAVTSNVLLHGDESATILGRVLMGQMREEWRKEMKEMRELIELRLPPPSLPDPLPSESPSGSGPPPVKAVVPPTGVSKKKGGKKGKKKEPEQRSAASRQPNAGPPPPPTEKKKDPSKKPGPPTPPGGDKTAPAAPSAAVTRREEEQQSWATVTKRGKKKIPPKAEGIKAVPKPPPPPPSQEGGRKKGGKKRKNPRTAAITLTCPEGEYSATVRQMREKISLKNLGISGKMTLGNAQTGAMLVQLSGPDRKAEADRLAKSMVDLFADNPEIRIARPQKMGEIRISGTDPSVTPEDITRVVAELGECSPADIKVGDLKTSGRGIRSAWVRCPLEVAIKATKTGQIAIGWFPFKVELLDARPLQCHRCLEMGHVQAKCPSGNADRRKCCYRCGTEGHEARTCTAPAHCVVCQAAGRPASHRAGGPACKAPKNGEKKKKGGTVPTPPPNKKRGRNRQRRFCLPWRGPAPPRPWTASLPPRSTPPMRVQWSSACRSNGSS
ncbi:uncharacterized protein [Linepithema humile]|uniref:uncharacterized protein n=1 Tax=Linepithema humile TaxID=83485 RepID=UPI00351F53E0